MMKCIDKENKIVEITPELLAEAFWNMDSGEQAMFYNSLDSDAEGMLVFQLQAITDGDGLTLGGRRVMQSIGEYSHLGLVPQGDPFKYFNM
jgi:hypothetical protein